MPCLRKYRVHGSHIPGVHIVACLNAKTAVDTSLSSTCECSRRQEWRRCESVQNAPRHFAVDLKYAKLDLPGNRYNAIATVLAALAGTVPSSIGRLVDNAQPATETHHFSTLAATVLCVHPAVRRYTIIPRNLHPADYESERDDDAGGAAAPDWHRGLEISARCIPSPKQSVSPRSLRRSVHSFMSFPDRSD